jgi:glycosyltransferase involved in cell wall biosynthesis
MFTILIPTFNNLNYLKLCVKSIKKNSQFNHEIIPHVNIGNDGTIDYLRKEKINFTYTEYNSGICEGVNRAACLAKYDYLLYAHDDFYFSPNWDKILINEVKKIGHNKFYLSGTMMHNGQIPFDCGENIESFNEEKFLSNYKKYNYYNFQGSTWAPTLVHKSIWNKVGGFSEEYFPGTGSDPDFNFKLWNVGVRIFKGLNDFKVYHFGSIVLRKKISRLENKQKYGSKGGKIFLLKWGISIKFFKKFYLRSNTIYSGPLENPKYDFKFLIYFIKTKINYFYIRLFYRKLNKINFRK